MRTISSPTLATDRGNEHRVEGASGSKTGLPPEALGLLSQKRDDDHVFPQKKSCHAPLYLVTTNLLAISLRGSHGSDMSKQSFWPMWQMGDPMWEVRAQKVGNRAETRTWDSVP